VLFALGQPIALVGLLIGFAVALLLRAVVQHALAGRGRMAMRRAALFDHRRDIDPFGVVAGVLGGTGWGRKAPEGADGRPRLAVLWAGPVSVLIASQLAFLVFRLIGGDAGALRVYFVSDIVYGGIPGSALTQFFLSFAVGLLCFGLVALVPLPPLDGWGLVARRAGPRPGTGFAKAQFWLEEKNVGVAVLLFGFIIPLAGGLPLFLFLLNAVATPVMRLWA